MREERREGPGGREGGRGILPPYNLALPMRAHNYALTPPSRSALCAHVDSGSTENVENALASTLAADVFTRKLLVSELQCW